MLSACRKHFICQAEFIAARGRAKCIPGHGLGCRWTRAGSSRRLVEIDEERLDELMQHEVAYLASVPDQAMSVRQILDAAPEDLARICWQEGPKRLALRIRFLEDLSGWQDVPELVKMHGMLKRWYRLLTLSDKQVMSLVSCVTDIRKEGQTVIPLVAAGVHRLQHNSPAHLDEGFLNRWLDSFFLSRISTNLLADQLVATASVEDGGDGRPAGIINPRCNATETCETGAMLAAKLCFGQTGFLPEFTIETYDASSMEPTDSPCLFSYIPAYLRYIVLELMKNSFKATVERSTSKEEIRARPVRILVCHDEEKIAIMISDRAGGIPFENVPRIWSYLYGACARSSEGVRHGASPLGGFGVGLPLSRLYARYLGGALHLTSYPGFGTQAHLLLPRITVKQVEKLPSRDV